MTNGRCVVNVHTAADNTVKNGVLTVNVTDEKNNVITNTVNFTLTNNITKVLFDGREGIIDKPMVPGTYYNVAISVLPEDTTQTDWKITALSGLDSRFSQISGPDNHTLRFMVDKNITGETITDDAVLNLQFSAVTSVPVSITAHIVSGGYIEMTGAFEFNPDAYPQVSLVHKPYKDNYKHENDSISMSYLGHTQTSKTESETRQGGTFEDYTNYPQISGDVYRRTGTNDGTGITATLRVNISEEEGPDYAQDEDDYIYMHNFYMYRDTPGTRDANDTFNYDFPSDGYTMRISLGTPECATDYQFGYPDRKTVKTYSWVTKYYNGTRWISEGYNHWNDNPYNAEYENGVKTVKFVNCVIDKPIKFYAAPESIKFINCIINCSSPVLFNVRSDNADGYEYNNIYNIAIDYTNCTFTVSDFDDTNMRTPMFYTYQYNEQTEDYDYNTVLTNMVDVTVKIKYGDVDITSAAYTALNQETSVSELPTGCTIKYGSGTTEHAIEYLRKQWGSSAAYMVKNENQETPFWIQIGQIVGTGGQIARNTATKYPANIRYNINSDDFSQSTVLTTLNASTLNTGDKVYFWGDLNTVDESSYASYTCPIAFNFSISNVQGQPYGSVLNNGFKTVAIGGNVMSLYYMDDFDSHDTVDSSRQSVSFFKIENERICHWMTDASKFYICPNLSYASYFSGHYALVSLPDFSHITSVNANQFNSMFNGCKALVDCPDLSNITIIGAKGCQSMFNGCTSLTRAILPKELTSSSQQSCATMFNGCTSLVDTTYMHISGNTGGACFYKMFMNCTALTTADIFIDANASTVATPQWEPTLNNTMSYDSATDKVTFSGTSSFAGSVNYVYRYMFMNCNHLTNFLHPVNIKFATDSIGMFATTKISSLTINFTGTGRYINDQMFYHSTIESCTLNITANKTPEEPSTSAYKAMFDYATSLQYLYAPNITRMTSGSIMTNVPETGTIVVSSSVDNITAGTKGIPATWTVEYALN